MESSKNEPFVENSGGAKGVKELEGVWGIEKGTVSLPSKLSDCSFEKRSEGSGGKELDSMPTIPPTGRSSLGEFHTLGLKDKMLVAGGWPILLNMSPRAYLIIMLGWLGEDWNWNAFTSRDEPGWGSW